MTERLTTRELALLFETQGYEAEARRHYLLLLDQDPGNPELSEDLARVTAAIASGAGCADGLARVRTLAGTWAGLLVGFARARALAHLRKGAPET
jgi:hypothetical protein